MKQRGGEKWQREPAVGRKRRRGGGEAAAGRWAARRAGGGEEKAGEAEGSEVGVIDLRAARRGEARGAGRRERQAKK